MPLDAEDVPSRGQLQGFGHGVVIRSAGSHQPLAEFIDTLMMVAERQVAWFARGGGRK
jgi:hypothetical protein